MIARPNNILAMATNVYITNDQITYNINRHSDNIIQMFRQTSASQ